MNFEIYLKDLLQKQFKNSLPPENLEKAIEYSLLTPGKRFRPLLLMEASILLGLPETVAKKAAAALEMVHCFTLIHDDLPCMDNSDLRRGLPSNHKVHGEAVALLAGDTLFALAYETLLSCSEDLPLSDSGKVLAAMKVLLKHSGASGVMSGQAREFELGPRSRLEDLERMHSQKTGALFEAAFEIPLALSGLPMDSSPATSLIHFGRALGRAFQILDDLEDAEQDVGLPTNILAFQSAEKSRETALQLLRDGFHFLDGVWGRQALTLKYAVQSTLKITL